LKITCRTDVSAQVTREPASEHRSTASTLAWAWVSIRGAAEAKASKSGSGTEEDGLERECGSKDV